MGEQVEPTRSLDCTGLFCPMPLFKAQKVIDQIGAGDVLELLADDPAAEDDLTAFARRAGHEVVSIEDKGAFRRFLIRKGGV